MRTAKSKFVAGVVTLAALVFTGCGGSAETKARQPETTAVTESVSDIAESITSTSQSNVSMDENTSPSSDSTKQLWYADIMYNLGTVEGNVYESRLLGYGCKLEGWIFADEDRIAEINQWAQENISKENLDLVEESPNIIEMSAESPNGLQNLNIQYHGMEELTEEDVENMDEFVDMIIQPMEESLKAEGMYNNLHVEKTDALLDGDRYAGILISAEIYGAPIYQKMIWIKRDGYFAIVAGLSAGENKVDEIFDKFYKLPEG